MHPPGKARTDRNKYALHNKNYKTVYMSDITTAKLDKLKKDWFLNGRGKVIEKLLHLYETGKLTEEKNDAADIDRYV